jgi:hypothetical protein
MLDSSSMQSHDFILELITQGRTENLLHRDPDEEFEGVPFLIPHRLPLTASL